MVKKLVILNEATEKALNAIAKDRKAPVSAIIREALELYLHRQGFRVKTEIEWGGKRDTPEVQPQKKAVRKRNKKQGE